MGAEAAITVVVAKLSFENSSFTLATVPEVVQVIAWVAPTVQISPPFGELTAKAAMILKFASETSLTVESAASATRTLTVAEMSLGTVQVYEPVLDVEAAITVAVAKLSFEYSSLTLGIVPVAVQVIVRLDATVHGSPPLGAVTVRAPRILKSALESSKTVESFTSVTRTRTVAEMSFGTVQANDPVFGVEAAIKIGVVKLSFEYSSLTLGIVPVVVQVIVRLSPTVQTSPPFGAVRVKAPRILKFVFEVAKASELLTSLTLTRTVVEMLFGTVQENVPVFGVEAMITFGYVLPPSVEYSSFTLGTVPPVVQAMLCDEPTVQTSPPLGAESVKPARIVKAASDASVTVASPVSVIRTLTVVESASGTVQA